MARCRLSRPLALLSFVLLGFATPADAANQLTNPNFSANVAGWSGGLWAPTWIGTDGNNAPGAARVAATSAGGSLGGGGLNQCTTATALATYDFGGAFKIDPTSTQTGGGRIRVVWWTGPGCTGTSTVADNVDPTSAPGWQALAFNNTVAPAGTNSVRIEVIQSVSGAGTFAAFWDDIYFGPDPTPVTLERFDAE